MLVLKRQEDEKIMIGDNIVVTVVEVQRGWVKLGIEAPKEIPVHRQEVYIQIKAKEDESAVLQSN